MSHQTPPSLWKTAPPCLWKTAALGTQVHDRGPALATPGPGFGTTQVHGPAFDTQVQGLDYGLLSMPLV